MITVSGSSDDLIEVEGDIREEFYYTEKDEALGDLIAFSNGVILRVRYDKNGVWRISPITGHSRVSVDMAPEDDESNYSDRATLHDDDVAWAVHGLNWAKNPSLRG